MPHLPSGAATRQVGVGQRRWPRSAVVPAFVAVFLVHAIDYLYFFVDDEAIPYVYAQHILQGHGIVYSVSEGRVEGYSNFLHVWRSTLILAIVQWAGWPKLTVFFIGKGISLAAGACLVWVTGRALSRLPGVSKAGLVAGLGFLALAAPLAMWSSSSLESVMFALLVTIVVVRLFGPEPRDGVDWVALLAAIGAVLERIDGFVYIGAVGGACLISAPASERRRIVLQFVAPVAAVWAVYQGWRVWYFGELLPMPLVSKVLYKLRSHGNVVTKPPEMNYVVHFFQTYGWGLPLVVWIAPLFDRSRRRLALPVAMIVGVLFGYLGLVGDWMAGFRFFVPVLPLLALLAGLAVSAAGAHRRLVGGIAAVVVLGWSAIVSANAAVDYDALLYRDSFWRRRSADLRLFFGPYLTVTEFLRARSKPGDLISYNQAGLVPFLLDVDNIDSLGITSKFFAKLPTTDIAFTEVGRYSALTSHTALRASDAYLLYRQPKYIVGRADNLRNANGGHAPHEILGGAYRASFSDGPGQNVVYMRTAMPLNAFRQDATRFLENLAHPSHLTSLTINAHSIPPRDFGATLPFLREQGVTLTVSGLYSLRAAFATADRPVYEVHINELWANQPMAVVLQLFSSTPLPVWETRVELVPGQSRDFHRFFSHSVGARALGVTVGAEARPGRVRLDDVRVQGQTPELAEYIAHTLRFTGALAGSR